MPPEDRIAFLDKLYGPDDEIRALVVKLLESDDSAADFIEAPIWTDSRFLNTGAKKEISNSLDQQFKPGERLIPACGVVRRKTGLLRCHVEKFGVTNNAVLDHLGESFAPDTLR